MLKACGNNVFSQRITRLAEALLYPGAMGTNYGGAYKPSVHPQGFTAVVLRLVHCSKATIVSVTIGLIPTIHSTNKNHKKFFTNNLLLISTGAV